MYDERMAIIWSCGNWIEESEGSIALADRGVLHGMGCFETMLAIDGRLQYAELHERRMRDSMARLGIVQDSIAWDLCALVHEICEKNNLQVGRSRLRLTATAGEGSLIDPEPGRGASIWLTAKSLPQSPSHIAVATLPYKRNEQSPLMGLKCCSYAENLVALRWAHERGVGEGIFFNHRDHLCEACTANVFVKIEGKWLTPSLSSGCLAGVMRGVILEQHPFIQEADISHEDFLSATEMFLSSVIRGIVPVDSCDGRIMPRRISLKND